MGEGNQYTAEFTQLMYHLATSETLTLEQAAAQLKRDAHVRTVRGTLARVAGISEDDPKTLKKFLEERLLESGPPDARRDSAERKVGLWLKNGVQAISKQSAIQLSFALGLSVDSADDFLHRSCGEGFHWRNPGEIVFLYALREGMRYREALALYDEMDQKGLLDVRGEDSPSVHTDIVRSAVERIGSAGELEDYLRESQGQLGALHNTAYHLFKEYLALLSAPEIGDDLDPEGRFSVREITDTYLHEKFVPRVKKGKSPKGEGLVLSALQRDIHQSWPDETTLSKMLNRKTDITRKALILLFLATNGETADYIREKDEEALNADEDDFSMEEGFEDLYFRMNNMLATCGFAPLDSRAPFDWMVLYCMCVDESMLIDERVQQFLTEIFTGEEKI